jgi:disulfide bond formation protein DsbB
VTLYPAVTLTLAIWAVLGVSAAVLLLVVTLRPGGRSWLQDRLHGNGRQPIAGAWVVALVAMMGSLYFSDIVGFTPCLLCWYQRILMYPLVFVLGVALWLREPGVWRTTLVLPLLGALIALYHVALQYRPSLELVGCEASAPCSGRYMAVFGFVSIPVLAASAFFIIVVLMITAAVAEKAQEPPPDVSAEGTAA